MLLLPAKYARPIKQGEANSRTLPTSARNPLPPPQGDYCQSLERCEVVREGTDVSIFTYSRMRYVVMQAVAELEKRGYNPEVGCVFY